MKTWRGSVKWLPQYCQDRQFSDNCCHFYMAGWSFPDYKSHLNISRTPYFCLKFGKKFIYKSHLSISCTLDCYFLARRNVLGCIHVMRRLAKERQDAIDVVQKTLNAGLIAWAKVCGPSQDMCDVCGSKSSVCQEARSACSARDIRRAFSDALPVRAVDGRVHAYTDRERERHCGRRRGGYTAAQTVSESVSDYGVLRVS